MQPWLDDEFVEHSRILLDSFRRYLGRELMDRSGDALLDAKRLYEAPFVVVSHGLQADPLITYANKAAQELWEGDRKALLSMPSRMTAEPMHRDERTLLLARTKEQGFADNYQGIRISLKSRRFRIEEATLWNLVDSKGKSAGQAATFSKWDYLPD